MRKRHTPTSSGLQNEEEEHIKVYVRARPMRSQFSKRCLKIIDKGIALRFKDKVHQLYFDGVFQEKATQKQVFEGACQPIIKHVLQGKNASLFVYGQTGSGKTFTMGTLEAIKTEQQGLVPLSLKYLIQYLKSKYQDGDWSISLSFMQIYMDQIIDLFNPRNSKLQIRQDLEYGQTYVENLVIVPIDNYQQSIDLINAGLKYRKVGNQKMNQLSSRSHTIFTIYVSQKISSTQFISSNFCLIDLAGSERIKKSNSTGIRLEEAKFINTSLSALGNVISGLAQNNSEKYIPYRSSKLTRILKHSLLGKSKVAVISTVDTSQDNTHQTYSTLLFADRCKQIRLQNQPVVNIQTFAEMDQEKDLRIALQKQQSKEKQYLELIKTLQDPSRASQNSQRQADLSQIIESIYKLFGEINDHLKRLLDGPSGKNNPPTARKQKPHVVSNTPVQSIKSYLTTLARQTIDHINNLSTIAFGQDGQKSSGGSKNQTEVLTSLLLDSMRQNLKLYESNLIKEGKQSLEKEIALQQYEKQRKQKVLNTIKSKKLKNLQNAFQEIWAQHHNSSNPLQSLLNNIRRGEMGLYGERSKKQEQEKQKQMTNPKEFLKMLTKQESQRRNKQMLIEEDDYRQRQEGDEQTKSPASSQIKYFQGRTPSKHSDDSGGGSNAKQDAKQTNSQIKKLLESLIASKSSFQQKRKVSVE